MRIKYVGFKLFSESIGFSTEEFFSYLHDMSGFCVSGESFDRYYFFNNKARVGYFIGLIVTLKNQKRFCRAERGAEGFRIKTEDLTGDDKLVDFNFFSLRKDTLKGVYQYYHHSCSPHTFGDVCKKRFYEKKEQLIEERYMELAPGTKYQENEKAYKKAKAAYKGRPKFSIIFDPRNTQEIISSFKEVKELDATFEAPRAPVEAGVAAASLSETIALRYKFGVTRKVTDIAIAVDEVRERTGFLRGKAKVINEYDEERMIDLVNCPDDFGQDDFDIIAGRINNLEAANFQENSVVEDLIAILENPDNAYVFSQKETDDEKD